MSNKKIEYQIGIDYSCGEDYVTICLRKGDRIVILRPEDFHRKGDKITLKKKPESYFKRYWKPLIN